MKPREFVVRNNADLRNCVYTVIPVIDRKLLDLPYHIHRLKQSFSLLLDSEHNLNSNFDSLHALTVEKIVAIDDAYFSADDLIARSCLESSKSTSAKDGLLTICVGLKDIQRSTDSIDQTSLEVNSFLYEMPSNFLSISPEKLTVDLQEYRRATDPRIKGAGWPHERSKLEISRHHEATETIIFSQTEPSPSESFGNHNDQDGNNRSNRNNDDISKDHFKLQLTEGNLLISKSISSSPKIIVTNDGLKYFILYHIRFRFDI